MLMSIRIGREKAPGLLLFAYAHMCRRRRRKGDKNMGDKKKEPRRYSHLSAEERDEIIAQLSGGKSFRTTAKRIGRSVSTAEREVKRALVLTNGWEKSSCPLRGKKYTVCNQCPVHAVCRRPKVYYSRDKGQDQAYEKKHALRRTGTPKSLVDAIDEEVAEGNDKGQSIEYIQHFYPNSSKVSAVTIRRWIIQGRLSTSAIRLRRRKAYRRNSARPGVPVIELDSVEGTTCDERSILTIMFVSEHFQYGRVYSKSDGPSEVAGYLRILLGELSDVAPGKEFVFLADNGIEFDGIVPLEKEFPFLHVFYASPYRSTDKAHCERNHEKFRYVVPKGISLDGFSQEDIDEMFSNVDSYATKATGWKRPCELLAGSYSPELLSFTGVRPMSVTDVNLRPKF